MSNVKCQMLDIITIGSATQDVFLTSTDYQLIPSKRFTTGVGECFAFGSKIEVKNLFLDTGGGATNAAVTFAHLGLKTACLTRVGADAPAREIRSVLKNEGVNTSLVLESKKEHTAYSTILLTQSGERTVLVYRGASSHFDAKEVPWKSLNARWFYIGSLGGNLSFLRRVFAHARKNNSAIAWNPGSGELDYGSRALMPFIQATDVLIMNREEAALLSGKTKHCTADIFGDVCFYPRGMTVVTDGPHGAYLCDHHEQFFSPSTGHKPVNTTGAGDAFGSGFVAGIMKGISATDALRLAILNSGLVVTKMGAKNGLLERMPSLSTLRKLRLKKLS